MKVLIQWSTKNPKDWEEIDSEDWPNLPSKPEPKGGEVIDDDKGWINHINVQGITFSGDHYAVEDLNDGSDGILVYCWNDDDEDYSDENKYAMVWKILPLAPREDLGGAIDTHQSKIIYAQTKMYKHFKSLMPVKNTVLKKWSEFESPKKSLIRHGIWLSDLLYKGHKSAKKLRTWMEWTEHLPNSELDEHGFLKDQRAQGRFSKAKGSITYYQRDDARATGVHVVSNENAFERTTGVSATIDEEVLRTSDELTHVFTTPANEPNSDDWPNGLYRFQFNVAAAEAELTYGLLTIGGSAGHFARVDAGLTADQEIWTQDEGAFSGTGTNIASNTINPVAGLIDDRFECLVACANAAIHQDRTLSMTVNVAASFADGPWTAAPPAAPTGQKAFNFGLTTIASIIGLIFKRRW
ncbi:hypothetical protein KAR91_69125 [Candidatus Pacearchaeota archaeon]|nr:hypothetical protein [Candidatus Pacearchaeota archaeon]